MDSPGRLWPGLPSVWTAGASPTLHPRVALTSEVPHKVYSYYKMGSPFSHQGQCLILQLSKYVLVGSLFSYYAFFITLTQLNDSLPNYFRMILTALE